SPSKGNGDHFNMEAHAQTENVVGASGASIPATPHDGGHECDALLLAGYASSFPAALRAVVIIAHVVLAQIGTSLVGDLPATCTPNGDNVLATVTVEDPEPEDTVAPVISLNGDNPMELEVGETYDEPGATAEDDVDGDVSDAIEVSGD